MLSGLFIYFNFSFLPVRQEIVVLKTRCDVLLDRTCIRKERPLLNKILMGGVWGEDLNPPLFPAMCAKLRPHTFGRFMVF